MKNRIDLENRISATLFFSFLPELFRMGTCGVQDLKCLEGADGRASFGALGLSLEEGVPILAGTQPRNEQPVRLLVKME